jgi:hypothetical protein
VWWKSWLHFLHLGRSIASLTATYSNSSSSYPFLIIIDAAAYHFLNTPIQQYGFPKNKHHRDHRRAEREDVHAGHVPHCQPPCRRRICADESNGWKRSGEDRRHAGRPSPLRCTRLQHDNGRRTPRRFRIGGGRKNVSQHFRLCSRNCDEHSLAGTPGRG